MFVSEKSLAINFILSGHSKQHHRKNVYGFPVKIIWVLDEP